MVNPVAASSAFATIVGLVCNYAAERRADVSDPFADFMDYLRVSHDEIRRKIDENRSRAKEGQTYAIDKVKCVTPVTCSEA